MVQSVSNPAVDGTFTDDVGGVPEEHRNVMRLINMTAAQLAELRAATTATHKKLVAALIAAGKYNWQAFGGGDGSGPTLPAATGPRCIQFMDEYCDPAKQQYPLMMDAGAASNNTVAAFLIIRPPIGFIGWVSFLFEGSSSTTPLLISNISQVGLGVGRSEMARVERLQSPAGDPNWTLQEGARRCVQPRLDQRGRSA